MSGLGLILPSDPFVLPVVSGGANYYDNAAFDGGLATFSTTALTMVANRLYATPIVLPAGTYDRVGILVGAGGGSGKLARVLLYAPNGALPDALILDPGSDLDANTIANPEHTINLVIGKPTLLIAAVWSDGTPQIGGWTVPGRNWWGSASASAGRQAMLYHTGYTYGTTPPAFGSATAYVASMVPRIRFRAA